MKQRSPEWFEARRGKFTSSRISDLRSRRYLWQLAMERLTGRSHEPTFVSRDMQWGIDHEDEAAELYALLTGRTLRKVGFVDHPSMPNAGASPDRLVNDDGLIEIKCPATHTHGDYYIGAATDAAYVRQMQWQLEVTKRAWCDWVSYDPRFEGGDIPVGSEIIIRRFKRDDEMIKTLRMEVRKADAVVKKLVKQTRGE